MGTKELLKNSLFLFALLPLFAGVNVDNIFRGEVSLKETTGTRVTVFGTVDATGCDNVKKICRLRLYRILKGVGKVFFMVYFREDSRWLVAKKWVSDPIIATCAMKNIVQYEDCIL